MSILKETPLKNFHLSLNAKFINFHSYNMPLNYSSIIEEVINTRNKVSFFDLYHMGRLLVKKNENLNKLFSVSLDNIKYSKAKYALLLNERFTIEDDIVIYDLNDHLFIVCNAVNKEKNINILKENKIEVNDVSDDYLMIAIQGPLAENIVNNFLNLLFNVNINLKEVYFYDYVIVDKNFILSRSGYTGEDGFEIYLDYKRMLKLMDYLINNKVNGAGLGARDVLRIEAGLALYGNEINTNINPLEANLKWAIKNNYFDKFIQNSKVNKKLVGLKVINTKKVPRNGYKLYSYSNQQIGYITSGTYSPILSTPIALAYIDLNLIDPNLIKKEELPDYEGLIENKENFIFKITKLPFIKTKYYKKNN
ncbi:MAG: glycine cleavage system aminomethyltransferase GcvT [bacterium]